jgi:putative hemolysin
MKKEILLSIIIALIIIAGGLLYWNKENNKVIQQVNNFPIQNENANTTPPVDNSGIANPASTYCKNKGGTLKIEKKPDGSE